MRLHTSKKLEDLPLPIKSNGIASSMRPFVVGGFSRKPLDSRPHCRVHMVLILYGLPRDGTHGRQVRYNVVVLVVLFIGSILNKLGDDTKVHVVVALFLGLFFISPGSRWCCTLQTVDRKSRIVLVSIWGCTGANRVGFEPRDSRQSP